MNEQPNLQQFVDHLSSFSDEQAQGGTTVPSSTSSLPGIGTVLEIAGSGSRVAMDAAHQARGGPRMTIKFDALYLAREELGTLLQERPVHRASIVSRSPARSRAQWERRKVVVDASHVWPAWAPPSPSPKAEVGWRSISPTASRLPSV